MPFRDHRLTRRTGIGALVTLLLSRKAVPAGAQLTATVVGTATLDFRECLSTDCASLGTLSLGESVTIIDESTPGFVEIEHGDAFGYVPSPFVTTDVDAVPPFAEGRAGCKRVALIFNIGIGDEPAIGILDTLKDKGVPATMFVMGWWASEHPAALTRLINDGHLVGSHGDQPVEPTTRSNDEIDTDLHAAATSIEHATGLPPARYYTAYAAAMDERVGAVVARSGYLPVAWKVPANDYGPDATANDVYDRVMGNIYDGAIVELHLDGPASANSTGVALPRMIADLREQGYRFVTIPDLIWDCTE